MSKYTLSDFTSLPKKFLKYDKHHQFYETFEYPEYERVCWKIQKYIRAPPSETLENMMLGCYGSDHAAEKKELYSAISIFEAIEKGDLDELKSVHNKGYSIGFYKSSVMGTAVEYKQLHIVTYLYNKEPRRYSDWEFTGHFPMLDDLIRSKATAKTEELEDKNKELEEKNKELEFQMSRLKIEVETIYGAALGARTAFMSKDTAQEWHRIYSKASDEFSTKTGYGVLNTDGTIKEEYLPKDMPYFG